MGIATLSITARWLGPEARGLIAGSTTWVSIVSSLVGFSIGLSVLHLSTSRLDTRWIRLLLGNLLFFTASMTFLGWCAIISLFWLSNGQLFNQITPLIIVLAFLGLPFMLWDQYGGSLLIALDSVGQYNNSQLISKTLSLPMLVGTLFFGGGILGVLVVQRQTDSLAHHENIFRIGLKQSEENSPFDLRFNTLERVVA